MARRSSGRRTASRRASSRRAAQGRKSRIAGLLRVKRVKLRKRRVTAGGPRRRFRGLV